ncbi:MAG: hypothetical protein LBC92_01345 [Rickettsiales bacterium]|jgi:hypothetical protein|nr:hypothetical protein [Rickettsiales bacterium]
MEKIREMRVEIIESFIKSQTLSFVKVEKRQWVSSGVIWTRLQIHLK